MNARRRELTVEARSEGDRRIKARNGGGCASLDEERKAIE